MQVIDILNDFQNWFRTQERQVVVYMARPKVGYKVYNKFLNTSYYTTMQQQFVISRTSGEKWTVSGKKLKDTYKFFDGEEVSQESLTSKLKIDDTIEWQKMTSISKPCERLWAIQIPLEIVNSPMLNSEVETGADGLGGLITDKVIYINKHGVTHGTGDFIVAKDVNGVPDMTKLRLVNGELFSTLYDISYYRGQELKIRRIQKPAALQNTEHIVDINNETDNKIAIQIQELSVTQEDGNQGNVYSVSPIKLYIALPKETSKRAKVNDLLDFLENKGCDVDSIKNAVVVVINNSSILDENVSKIGKKFGCFIKLKSDLEIQFSERLDSQVQTHLRGVILKAYKKELENYLSGENSALNSKYELLHMTI